MNDQCLKACESLGDVGGLVFTLIALAWGFWQRYQKSRAVVQTLNANARATQAEAEKAVFRELSLRPAPMPVALSLPPDILARFASAPVPHEYGEPHDSDYAEHQEPTVRAKPGGK